MDERKRILRDSTQYLLSTIVAQGAALFRSVAIPVLLGPAQLGIWNLMNVIIGYGANAHMGILHGMNKKVPMLRGLGNAAEFDELKDSSYWASLLLSLIAAAALFLASFLVDPAYASSIRIVALVVVLQMVFVFYFCLLRGDNRFDLVSRGIAGLSVLSSVTVLALAYVWPDRLLGALWGIAAAYPFVLGYWYRKSGYRFGFSLRREQVRSAFVLGFPLILLGFMDMIFLSMDRWIIAWKLSETELGYYALGIMAGNLLGLVPISASNVLYPRMLQRYAVSGDSFAVSGLLLNPVRAITSLMIFLAAAATIALPVAIRLLLPAYIPAISLVEIVVPGSFFLAIAYSVGNFVVAVDRQRVLIAFLSVAMAVALVLDIALLSLGYGVRGIAWATVIGYAVYGLGYLGVSVHLAQGKWRETLRFLSSHLGLFLAMMAALISTGPLAHPADPWGSQLFWGFVRLLAVSVLLLPFVWLVNRNSGVWSSLMDILSGWRRAPEKE
ncbi:MAG: oligosaccharide flippase family protein [Thermodesulfobacteriota bacterium]